MQIASGAYIHMVGRNLTLIRALGKEAQTKPEVEGELHTNLRNLMDPLMSYAKALGLDSAKMQLIRIQGRMFERVDPNPIHLMEVNSLIDGLESRVQDDLSKIKFGFIPQAKVDYYECLSFGPNFDKRFPRLLPEVRAAGTCYAHGLNTACVFHLMRVMEAGVQYLGKRVGVSLVSLSGGHVKELTWGEITREMRKAVNGWPMVTVQQKRRHERYSEIISHLNGVKDAWRNPTMHPRASYEPIEALNILTHVQSFMTSLSE